MNNKASEERMFSVNSQHQENRPTKIVKGQRENQRSQFQSILRVLRKRTHKPLHICVRSILTQYTTKANVNASHNVGV